MNIHVTHFSNFHILCICKGDCESEALNNSNI